MARSRRTAVSRALATVMLTAVTVAGCASEEATSGDRDQPPRQTSPQAPQQAAPEPTATGHLTHPRAVADQIAAADAAIADPATGAEDLTAAGQRQQIAFRVLGRHPAWDDRVRELLPAGLWPTVRDSVASRRDFRSMHTTLSDTLPAWRIVAPEPAADLLRHYRAAEERFGVGWEYLAAINLVETGMGRIRGTSVAGAQGPMQFIPATWEAHGRGDVNDPGDAIMAAARYLDARGFEAGDDAAIDGALYGYNNHVAYVRGVRLLAETMQRRPRLYLGYHAWDVHYLTTRGDVLLPIGYDEREPVPVRDYLRR